MSKNPIIECKNLGRAFTTGDIVTHALKSATCTITKGEFVSIMGPSGSGKSTLMHLMSFLDKPTSGTYYFKGLDTKDFSEKKLSKLRNQEIGFVFQSFNLLSSVNIYDNVELPLLYDFYTKSESKEKRKSRVLNALKSVGMLHRKNHKTNQLSGGEKQRVAIARALVNNPEIIFADEPTGNLDSKSGNKVMRILQDLHSKGHTIILVTHEQATAEHGTRILNLIDGEIVKDEPVNIRRIANKTDSLKK